ncbi:amino acid permease [Sistotremastrum niveocremeum HHB9708]|uniref:Amino acid permease n=1 Tax=Sistotremastrum niveocremeum HHB9708 TaxID=1314777 RepID=A0A164S2D6_9AGAM|nr:amino acid permease [Sistotremastrum niveocremeum HHB9708]
MASHEKNAVFNDIDSVDAHDDEVLHKLGLQRELRKEFTKLSTLGFALGVLGCSASVASTFNTPILLGGPGSAIYSWILGSFGCLAIASSVAELISAYPTAGGIYTTTAFVVPPRYRASVSFVAAWITVVGQLAAPAGVNFALSQMIFAAVTIATDGSFVASTGQILGLYVGLNVATGLINSLPTKALHRLSMSYVFINIFTTLACIIAIPAAGAGNLAPSNFVWGHLVDTSGWNNRGFALLLGLFCVQWVMTDYDAAAHLSEEVKNAAITAPVSIVSGVTITAVMGFFLNISLCYGIRDLSALPGPTGLVFAQILWDNLGKRGALALWSFVILLQAVTGVACQLSCIRSIYAISRDNALPDRKLLSKVWPRTKTPVIAAVFVVVIAVVFGLLFLASIVAINAVFSITAVALDLSYMIPVSAKLWIWLTKSEEVKFRPGPFNMGTFGYFVNLYAFVWTLLETGVLIMPQVRPVNGTTMNYTGPIVGGVCGISWLWYMLYWHRNYAGPGGHNKLWDDQSSEVHPESTGSVEEKREKA